MQESHHSGHQYFGGFFVFIGGLWLLGAALAVAMAMLGSARLDEAVPSSNQSTIGESPETL